jgi:hypothetical protein
MRLKAVSPFHSLVSFLSAFSSSLSLLAGWEEGLIRRAGSYGGGEEEKCGQLETRLRYNLFSMRCFELNGDIAGAVEEERISCFGTTRLNSLQPCTTPPPRPHPKSPLFISRQDHLNSNTR